MVIYDGLQRKVKRGLVPPTFRIRYHGERICSFKENKIFTPHSGCVTYGMLLSRSWGKKLRGSLQLDMTYTTILIFGGQFTRLYKETRLAYTVSDPQNPNNYLVYVTDQDLWNCILSLDDDFDDCIK
jgi:hypothetical protein